MLNRYDESARCAGGNGRCAAYVDDVSGDCLHFIDALRRRGFSETDIDGIASGNFLRVLGRVVG